MKDVQSERDNRNLPIDQVGISSISWPIQVLDRSNEVQDTVAEVSLSVYLPKDHRGTHMSRFIEVLSMQEKRVTLRNMEETLMSLKKRLNADEAHAEFHFPYFITKKAPISAAEGRVRYDVSFKATLKKNDFDLITEVVVPIQTLCPCSKEISRYGAHSQRAYAKIEVRMKEWMWLEELAEIGDSCGSAPIYSILKREDEKEITERAYNNPRFVEDAVRELALVLDSDDRISWFRISVTSQESIHNHNAFASIERDKSKD